MIGAGPRWATEANYHEGWRRGRDEVDLEALAFCLGPEEYGLDIRRIREIIKLDRPITEVPRAPQFVPGILSVRGEVVPIVDLRLRLKMTPAPRTRDTRVLIVRRDPDVFGLIVDSVKQVVRMREEDLEPTPPAIGGALADFLAGIGRPTVDRMLILINLDAVLAFGGVKR